MQDREYIKSGFQQKKNHGSGEGAANMVWARQKQPSRSGCNTPRVFLVSKQSEALGTAPSRKFWVFFKAGRLLIPPLLSAIRWAFWQIRTNRCHKSSPPSSPPKQTCKQTAVRRRRMISLRCICWRNGK